MQRKQSAQLDHCCVISPRVSSSPFRGDQNSPVHYVCPHRPNWNWKCYVPLRCPPNRLPLSNQASEAITNQKYESRWFLKRGVGRVGVSDSVFIPGVRASSEWSCREVKPDWLSNYGFLFFLAYPPCFTLFCLDEETQPWQIKQDALLRWLSSEAPVQETTGRQSESSQGDVFIRRFKGDEI